MPGHLIRIAGLFAAAVISVHAADVRDRTRPKTAPGTVLSAAQAQDLTLTLAPASVRALQTSVRGAGTLESGTGKLTALICTAEADLLKLGQRVRAFPVHSRSSMYQGRISRIEDQSRCASLEITMAGQGQVGSNDYVLEIVVDRGEIFCVPNEAVIEEEGRRIVYVHTGADNFDSREVITGVQGDLYTQILKGLNAGDEVVTIGSFFIDADFKMKGAN